MRKNSKQSTTTEVTRTLLCDFVMLRSENITSPRQCKKFDERYIGPFPIIDTWGIQIAFGTEAQRYSSCFSCVASRALLCTWRPPTTARHYHYRWRKEYVIDEIVSVRTHRRQKQYLVSWKGYSPPNNTSRESKDAVNDTEALEIHLQRQNQKEQSESRQGRGKSKRSR